MTKNGMLRTLNISGNKLAGLSKHSLTTMLAQNTALTTLIMNECHI